jgi:hypothetical protein
MKTEKTFKTIDILVWSLLVLGGANWGLVGLFDFNLVAAIFGEMSLLTRIAYVLVGLSAAYEIAGVKAISKRWGLHYRTLARA